MNILFVTKRCIKSHGGFDRIAKLAERGHNIHILGTGVKDEPSYEFSYGVNIHRCGSFLDISQLQYPISFPVLLIKRLTKEFDIDLTHGLGLQATNTASVGILARLFSSVPFVLSIQGISKTGGSPFVDALSRSYDFSFGRMIVKTCRKVIVLGKALVGRALQLGASKEKIIICPPGVDVKRFNPDMNPYAGFKEHLGLRRSFVIGFVGRFVQLKGIFDLIKACKIVSKEHSIHLLLIGDGPLREKLVRTTHSQGIPATITGWVSNPEIYYSVMDVFVLPSYSEGLPRTCLEAMAMEKPLIVTDVGASREIVRNAENGFIVSPGNPELLAEKIFALLENNSILEEWGRTSRSIVEEKYTLDEEVRRLERIYYEVVDECN